MTWREWMTEYLTDCGLQDDEAESIADLYFAEPAPDVAGPLTNRPYDHDTPKVEALVRMTINQITLEWIDANKPKHFARPMFLPKDERDKLLASSK